MIKNVCILFVICLLLVTAFPIGFYIKNYRLIAEARNPETSISRANRASAQDYLQGKAHFISYYNDSDGCVLPVVTKAEVESNYPDYEAEYGHHGPCYRMSFYRKYFLIEYHQRNEWYATAYNANLLRLIHLDY